MRHSIMILALVAAVIMAGCGELTRQADELRVQVNARLQAQQDKQAAPAPVVRTVAGSWLAGSAVKRAEPELPVLGQEYGYHPAMAVSLAEFASWVTQTTGLQVDVSELQQPAATAAASPVPVVGTGAVAGAPGVSAPANQMQAAGVAGQVVALNRLFFNYEGRLSGLLDVAANKVGAWWKISDGDGRPRAVFYRTETKTFYLPVPARDFDGSNTITTASSSSGGSTGTSGTTAGGGATATSTYTAKQWDSLLRTAEIVAGGGKVSLNQFAGSITVSGTPAQVRNVGEWVTNLAEQLSQQVLVTVDMYTVKRTREDNLSWNPSVIFKAGSGVIGAAVTAAQAPVVVGGQTAFSLAASAANNASSGQKTQYNGSQLALAALSTLGEVIASDHQQVVTMNNQPAPIQAMNSQGYIASTSITQTANVGSSTAVTQATLVTGFTGLFTPRIVNGRVILTIALDNSRSNGFTTFTQNGTVLAQTPNFDQNATQQSVSLTPGSALMLTQLERRSSVTQRNGVGSPNNMLLGGGRDDVADRQFVAVIISVEIL